MEGMNVFESQRSSPPLPLTWVERLVATLDQDAPEGALTLIRQLREALAAFAHVARRREDCQDFRAAHGDLVAQYFQLVEQLVTRFGHPDMDTLAEEWEHTVVRREQEASTRSILRQAYELIACTESHTHSVDRARLLSALETEFHTQGPSSSLGSLLSWRADLIVGLLGLAALTDGDRGGYASLLGGLCTGYRQALADFVTALYARLGRWKPSSLHLPHEVTLWQYLGEHGLRELTERLAQESDLDRMDAGSEFLIALWPASMDAIRVGVESELERPSSPDALLMLLQVLRWVSPAPFGSPLKEGLLVGSLRKATAHESVEIREAAARALVVWQGRNAVSLLQHRVGYETDEPLRELLLDLLAELVKGNAA